MISVVKNDTTEFLLPTPLACLEDWQPLLFWAEFSNGQTRQTKGVFISYVLTDLNGYRFSFEENDIEDLPNGVVNLGTIGNQWELVLYQSNTVNNPTAKEIYRERIQVYASI